MNNEQDKNIKQNQVIETKPILEQINNIKQNNTTEEINTTKQINISNQKANSKNKNVNTNKKIVTVIKNIWNKVLDYTIPNGMKCIFCNDEIFDNNKIFTCKKCLKTLPFNDKKICEKCGVENVGLNDYCDTCLKEIPCYDIARSPFIYKGIIKVIVRKFKFDNAKYLFAPLAQYMFTTYQKYSFSCDIIVPVPLSEARKKERGYNQVEQLANELSLLVNKPVIADNIERTKHTNAQANLKADARSQNVKNSFRIIDESLFKNKEILVMDDVITTGATINNICKEIAKSKPKSIKVLTLAHTILTRDSEQIFTQENLKELNQIQKHN